MNDVLKISRKEKSLPDLFKKSRYRGLIEVKSKWPIFKSSKINVDKIVFRPLDRPMNKFSLDEYVEACRNEKELRLDKFTCSALISNQDALEAVVKSYGCVIDNLVRIIFDGTIWKTHVIEFPAIAYIDRKFRPDIYPLDYFDKGTVLRAVLLV